MDLEKLARKNIQTLTPYLSARRIGGEGDVWLNANESPFDNKYSVTGEGLNRYSECQPPSLLKAYADYANVSLEQVLTSRGADESIDLLIRTFCEVDEDHLLFCPPTYGMYRVLAKTAGIKEKIIPLTSDWQLDLTQIKKNLDKVKLIFICSPNNPTGNLISRDAINALLAMTQGKALVVIDEAYIDFCPDASQVDLLTHHSHLVILRTLSKAFALAGLRCGFTLANPKIIQLLLKVIPPYPVPTPVVEIACQALSKEGVARMKQQVNTLNVHRDFLQKKLSDLQNVITFKGQGNYLLVKFLNATPIFSALWNNGIIVRKTEIQHCIRISIGNKNECEKTYSLIRQQINNEY